MSYHVSQFALESSGVRALGGTPLMIGLDGSNRDSIRHREQKYKALAAAIKAVVVKPGSV